ncbi:Cp190 [Drosophila busckii]|uniref:Cp190 n=1 Tax=Drosophila busckii TaxID=30019 RepID=A0A0M4EKL4_DROBS|nr:Cp190 [Drosophila busckii]
MGEVKSVKVDNWGVFFLQKLQNFFNKTDYCDLTLQFRDNSQLKVHRLVLSACTDYFNVLEQTCETIDDALIMPAEFQADVVVPIVNFMYTGTLEFELKMYGKLLRTAKEMNMTVLLKLLEAHRRTMENPPSPKGIRRRPVVPSINTQQRAPITSSLNRGVVTAARSNVQQRTVNTPAILRSGGLNNRSPYGDNSPSTVTSKQESTSPFEQLRKGYNNNKRPAQTSLLSPPSKKPSLEEVKEFAEQQRMRKQIAAEFGDHADAEYDNMLYDDVHAGCDDDDDDMPPQPSTSKQSQPQTPQQSQSGGTQAQVEHGTTTIILKQDSPSQTPTIIVKDSSNAKLNHTKIIAEVLRQYPHIVKGHKNIKLKIMPNSPVEKPSINIKRGSPAAATPSTSASVSANSPHKKLHVSFKSDKPMISTQQQQQQQKPVLKSAATTVQAPATSITAAASTSAAAAMQKRRIDSKTMHSLISLGAENTTGPWLCLRCGVNGRPISIPSYRGFRRHLINTHKETIDPALCEHCGWRSSNNRELHFHMYKEHQIKSLLYNFAECGLCNRTFLSKTELDKHINEAHTDENKQQCIYCNKMFAQELQLYRHMKSSHKAQALEDGIIDETDEEYLGSQDEDDDEQEVELESETPATSEQSKVRILSDISLPATSAMMQQQETSEESVQEQEVKFVNAEGNEVELTEEQRKEILSQLNQQAGTTTGGVVMVLSEQDGETEGKQDTDAKSNAGTEEEYDDSQIYSELAAAGSVESSSKKSDGAGDESKESMDNLEWAENLISKHDELETEQQNSKEPKPEKRRDDIREKLKELTGDWSEDENDEEDEDVDSSKQAIETATTEEKTEAKTTAVEPVAEVVEEEQSQAEEDDIDLAMQSLHTEYTGEAITVSTPPVVTSEASGSGDVSQTQSEPEPEKMDVDEQPQEQVESEEKPADIVEQLATEIKEEEVNAQYIKDESPEETQEEKTDTMVSGITVIAEAAATPEDVHLETENIRKELLDELIAEAEAPDADAMLEDTQPFPGASDTPPADAVIEHEDAPSNDAAEADESQQQVTTATEEKSAEPNSSDAVAKEENAQDEIAEVNNEELTTEPAGTQEKLKSLMSEWGDDEEDNDNHDDDDENGVSAATKEQL